MELREAVENLIRAVYNDPHIPEPQGAEGRQAGRQAFRNGYYSLRDMAEFKILEEALRAPFMKSDPKRQKVALMLLEEVDGIRSESEGVTKLEIGCYCRSASGDTGPAACVWCRIEVFVNSRIIP